MIPLKRIRDHGGGVPPNDNNPEPPAAGKEVTE
jgi:hypothetical protein